MNASAEAAPSVVFARSAGRQAFEGVGAGVGAVLFLGMAALLGLGVMGGDLLIRIVGLLGFGFFGLFMAASSIAAMQRGRDGRVAEVGPSGLWLPEMGELSWADIAEVRLERIRGVGSGRAPVTRQFRRLGVVPRDPELRPRGATALAWRMTAAYFSLVRAIAPEVRLGGDDAAPFGVSETDIPKDFDRLLTAVAQHVAVLDAAEARAHRVAGRWTGANPTASPAATPRQDLAALDSALGRPKAASVMPGAIASLVAGPGPASPRGTFSVPPVRPLEVALAVIPLVVPLAILVPVLVPSIVAGEASGTFGVVFLGIFLAAFALPGGRRLVRLAARLRERRAEQARLRIGPDGIWTRAGGQVAWGDVREIRTERAGWVRQIGSPQVERWRLVVETTGRQSSGVASDELDARFDDVLDLVRSYHPVVETS